MSSHNVAAGAEMTMTSVIRDYLRRFELQICKGAMRTSGVIPELGSLWLGIERETHDKGQRLQISSSYSSLDNSNPSASPAVQWMLGQFQ